MVGWALSIGLIDLQFSVDACHVQTVFTAAAPPVARRMVLRHRTAPAGPRPGTVRPRHPSAQPEGPSEFLRSGSEGHYCTLWEAVQSRR